jgi:hypothetical protein
MAFEVGANEHRRGRFSRQLRRADGFQHGHGHRRQPT